MLPVETSLITKRDTKPQSCLTPRIQAQEPPFQVPQDCTLFAGKPSCISRNVQNITIKQMLIHWIRRFPESFQIHFRKHLSTDQLPANIFLRVAFPRCHLVRRPLQGSSLLRTRFVFSVYNRKWGHFSCLHITGQCINKLMPSGGSSPNYYRLLTGKLLPLIQPQLKNEHIFFKQIT